MSDRDDFIFPPMPQRPNEEDCCRSDCEMCIFNVYERKIVQWEKMCNQIRQKQFKCPTLPSVLSEIKFSAFELIEITSLTATTNIYRFQVSEKELCSNDGKYSPNLNINLGQHLIMKYKCEDKGILITRAYTPISDNKLHINGCFEVIIKVYPEGEMSRYVCSWKKGEMVYWRGPFGEFTYSRNKYKHVVMCCAGTGIAPMFQVMKSIVEDDDEETFVYLLYSCKRYEDVLLTKEISSFQSFWNFSSCVFVTQEDPKNVRYGEVIVKGRMNLSALQRLLSQKPLDKSLVLICGTSSFNNDIKHCMKDLGVSEDNIWIF